MCRMVFGFTCRRMRNPSIRIVAIEKFVLWPQVILGKSVFVGLQNTNWDGNSSIPIKASFGCPGRIAIKWRNRFWQFDRLWPR